MKKLFLSPLWPAIALFPGCATASGEYGETGIASFYSDSLAGRPTASGEPYDPKAATCAHPKLPFGTVLEVVRVSNQKRATCRVNYRGPFAKKRIVDLSRAVAKALKINGVAKVKLRIIKRPKK